MHRLRPYPRCHLINLALQTLGWNYQFSIPLRTPPCAILKFISLHTSPL